MDRILFVDDEPNILNAFKRRLSLQYEFHTASSAKEGLELLRKHEGFAVIVSDMYMPEINGSQFLKECSKRAPDAVRVMLTGLADQKTAAKAINEGSVFRFINKPISLEELEKTLQECLVQRRLIRQEKDLLQNTLGGVIKLITDLLSFVDPEGVDKGNRLRKVVRELAGNLGSPSMELELGAMVAGVGRLSLPLELLNKVSQGTKLETAEEQAVSKTVGVSARLLKEIPRFERISVILEGVATGESKDAATLQQARIFQIGTKIVNQGLDSLPLVDAIARAHPSLSSDEQKFIQPLVGALSQDTPVEAPSGYEISLKELCPGQRILSDVKDSAGRLLLKKGFMVTPAIIERLVNHHELIGLAAPILVNERIPTRE